MLIFRNGRSLLTLLFSILHIRAYSQNSRLVFGRLLVKTSALYRSSFGIERTLLRARRFRYVVKFHEAPGMKSEK